MEFSTKASSDFGQLKTACLIVPVKQGKNLTGTAKDIDKLTGGTLRRLTKSGDFTADSGQTFLLHGESGLAAERLLLVGLGDKAMSINEFRKCVSSLIGIVKGTPAKEASLLLEGFKVEKRDTAWQLEQFARLGEDSDYQYSTTKAQKKKPQFKKFTLLVKDSKIASTARKSLAKGKAIGLGMNTAKQLGNLPANICTPGFLASEARAAARKYSSLSAKILNEKQMQELGMGSLLSVAAGTKEPAKLIIMEYKGAAKSNRPYVLVGKGITFDSGGISLKPSPKMDEMKFDMCGAASVFGTMHAVCELGLKMNVVALVAATENLPGGLATKPGDVITSMSGQTIEILNTDAEGRLVLCDALTYAERYKPQAVIDIATLTGACIVALGNHASALYSNQESLAQELLSAGEITHGQGLANADVGGIPKTAGFEFCRPAQYRLTRWRQYCRRLLPVQIRH